MVRRAGLAVALVVALGALPDGAAAQERGRSPRAVVPYTTVDTGSGDPYEPLAFERAGTMLPALRPAIIDATRADEAGLRVLFGDAIGGFAASAAGGYPLVGRAAPVVASGVPLLGSTSLSTSTSGATSTSSVASAIPARGGSTSGGRRTTFAFTDDKGEPVAPPVDLAPLDPPPSPPSEGVTAAPPPTTTTTAPPARVTGDDVSPIVEPAPGTTSTTSTTAPGARSTTTSTTRPAQPGATTSTTAPRDVTTTTAVTAPTTTTTTQPPVTTTTVAPPTTTTTVPPPTGSFSLTQERPSMTACVAGSSTPASCDALWDVQLAATGSTHSFDLTLRNSGGLDASSLLVWAAGCQTTSTGTPSGTGDLCGVVELTIQRYTSAARDVPLECVYGGGTAQVCSLSSARTLAHFGATHASDTTARAIGTGLAAGSSAHLRLTLHLPDVDNRYQNRAATMSITWRQVQ